MRVIELFDDGRGFELLDDNVVNAKTFVTGSLIESCSNSNRQRSAPRTRQRRYAGRRQTLLLYSEITALMFASGVMETFVCPARLAIHRHVRVLAVPEV